MSDCAIWGNTGTKWQDANWKWSECPGSNCAIWGLTGVLWKNANWKWSECSGSIIPPEPVINIGNLPGVDATTLIQPWQIEEPWNPYQTGSLDRKKRKRLIKLICKMRGEEYNEEKEVKNFNITVDDIKMIIKVMPKIDLNLKLEE